MRWFRSNAQPDEDGFYPSAVAADEVEAGTVHAVHIGDEKVIVTRSDGQLVAFASTCPHAAADLSGGRLTRGQIKCPDHGYTFDVQSGRCVWPPDEGCRLMRYTVKVEEGKVKIRPGAPAR